MIIIFLKVSVSEFLTLFSCRTQEGFFWRVKPGKPLVAAVAISLIISSYLAASRWAACHGSRARQLPAFAPVDLDLLPPLVVHPGSCKGVDSWVPELFQNLPQHARRHGLLKRLRRPSRRMNEYF
jgi:hypothetical protein